MKNCKAMAAGKAALADSTAHLAHCALEGQLHARHAALEATLLAMIQAADFGWGWRREVTLCTPGDGNPDVPKTWKSDLVGHDNMGRKCVIDTTVVTLTAPSYRGARHTLRSRCLRTLAEAVKNKLKLPRAAARAKDLQARHIVFCMSANGAFSAMAQDFFDEVKDHAKKQGLDHMGVSLIERHSVSFTTRFWNTFWSQRINASIGATGANRILQILATDRHMSHRMVTGSRDAAPVPLTHGRFGYGVPKAKRNSIALDEVEDNIADFLPAAASFSVLEEGAASHPQPAAAPPSAPSTGHSPFGDVDSAVEPASSVEHVIDDPGGGANDNVPGEGSINSVVHELDDPGGGIADDDPGGGSTTSADADSALNVSNTSKTSSSPLLSSFLLWVSFGVFRGLISSHFSCKDWL